MVEIFSVEFSINNLLIFISSYDRNILVLGSKLAKLKI